MEKNLANGKYKSWENLESPLYLAVSTSKLPNGMSILTKDLLEYLQQLQRQGETHVHLDDTSKSILRVFYKRAKLLAKGTPPETRSSPVLMDKTVAQSPHQEPIPSEEIREVEHTLPSKPREQPSSRPQTPSSPPTPQLKLKPLNPADSPELQLQSLAQQSQQWGESGLIPSLRNKAIFSSGNPRAHLAFVGDAPGYHEEKTSTPFNGPAGQKLDAILKAMGLNREEVYLSYLVKLRPNQAQQTTNTRKPEQHEIQTFLPIFEAEIQIVQPTVIIALGEEAGSNLLNGTHSLQELRSKTHDYRGIPLITTYPLLHLLHNEATTEKRSLWEDMLTAMELLNLPISEKQRGYFLKKS